MRREGDLPLTAAPTLDVWIDRWLNQTSNRIKPRVLDTYRSDCNAIRSVIGGMKLTDITGETIEGMCGELSDGRSGKTVHNYFIRLRQILDAAVREKLIPSNPALAAIPRAMSPRKPESLTPANPCGPSNRP